MKRTNVVLDERLLEQAKRVLGLKTYSATIKFALQEAIRIHKLPDIPRFFGKVSWDGNLSEMREDRRPSRNGPSGDPG